MIIEIRNITKRYRKVLAVDDFSLSVPENSVYGLLGLNGAGKTTILGICSGLVRPDKGDVIICDQSIRKYPDKVKQNIGLLVQGGNFYPDRTGLDHLTFYGKLSRLENPKEKAKEMMISVGLDEKMNDKVGTYSHGMNKLLNLAQALLANPKIVFLDEPISGLDPSAAYKVKKIIKKYSKKTTIIISSHHLEAIDELCSHVAIIKEGRLLANSTLAQVKKGKSLEKRFVEITS